MSSKTDPSKKGESPVALRVIYSGHVQGVGFRRTTANIAAGFAVAGYVQNLDSGDVELVVEGKSSELELFLSAVATRLERHIVNSNRTEIASTAMDEFCIRR